MRLVLLVVAMYCFIYSSKGVCALAVPNFLSARYARCIPKATPFHIVFAGTAKEVDEDNQSIEFDIREIQTKDLGAAATILADAFAPPNLNFMAQRMERMNTYLSLTSRFETFRYAERSGALQCMLVATTHSMVVVGLMEVDNRPPGGERNPPPRPYISNLAVARNVRRQGIATALLSAGERIVREDWKLPQLHLRVARDNEGARALYKGCGYSIVEDERQAVTTGREDGTTTGMSIGSTTHILLQKTL